MANRKQNSPLLCFLLGAVFTILSLVMIIHDASFIFLGRTVDLNEIMKNGGEPPRDKYVTYTCYMPLGGYAETTEYAAGIIPLPGKAESHAFIAENGMIMTIQTKNKQTKKDLAHAAEDFYFEDEVTPVEVVGCFQINSPDVDRLLEQFAAQSGIDTEEIALSSYCIDTTKTRLKITVMYVFMLALGVICIIMGIKSVIRRRAV